MKRGSGNRMDAELNRQFGDHTTMSNYEHLRDVEFFCDVTIFYSFSQCAKNGPINRPQPIDQQGEDIVGVDFGHNAFV